MSDLQIGALNSIVNYNKLMGASLPNAQGNDAIVNFEDVLQQQNNIIAKNFDSTHMLQGNVNFDENLFDKVQGVKETTAAQNTLNNFGKALTDGLKSVNAQQVKSENMTMAFAAGEDVSIHDVMIESQKASLNLALASQIRNKLVTAYNDIYTMHF